jgi:hypothetical protein
MVIQFVHTFSTLLHCHRPILQFEMLLIIFRPPSSGLYHFSLLSLSLVSYVCGLNPFLADKIYLLYCEPICSCFDLNNTLFFINILSASSLLLLYFSSFCLLFLVNYSVESTLFIFQYYLTFLIKC